MKVFKMDDYDWVAAENLHDAIKCYAETVSDGKVTAAFREEFCPEPYELGPQAMEKLQYSDDESKESVKRSFREELQNRIDRGEKFPQFFASTEF